MIKPGKIRIKDQKVFFEPDGLEKPNPDNYEWYNSLSKGYEYDLHEYEASKQLIEVSNVLWNNSDKDIYALSVGDEKSEEQIIYGKNNQPCKAEVTGDTCTIVELIKE